MTSHHTCSLRFNNENNQCDFNPSVMEGLYKAISRTKLAFNGSDLRVSCRPVDLLLIGEAYLTDTLTQKAFITNQVSKQCQGNQTCLLKNDVTQYQLAANLSLYTSLSVTYMCVKPNLIKIPYNETTRTATLPNGLRVGTCLYIRATPNDKPRLLVNLSTPKGEIAMHISVRFSENTIIFNSNMLTGWDREERTGTLSGIAVNREFVMNIVVTESVFQVSVDGKSLHNFSHRYQAFQEITTIRIFELIIAEMTYC